jgi:hypothetical protein
VLAGEAAEQEEPLLHPLELVRVRLERVARRGEPGFGLGDFGERPRHRLHRRAQQRVERLAAAHGRRLEPPERVEEHALGAVRAEGAGGGLELLADAGRGLKRAPARVERRLLALLRRGRVELGGGVPEEVRIPGRRLERLARRGERAVGLPPAAQAARVAARASPAPA